RYRALRQMAISHGASLVLLAHHRRDQAETFVLQALRSAGVAGLSGMPREIERDGLTWARPWLDVAREQIEAYVRRNRLTHVDDDSNEDTRFARNRLRHAVWPALQQAFAQAESALADAAGWAQQATLCLAELAAMDLANVAADATGCRDGVAICSLHASRRAAYRWPGSRMSSSGRAQGVNASRLASVVRPAASRSNSRLQPSRPGSGRARWSTAAGSWCSCPAWA